VFSTAQVNQKKKQLKQKQTLDIISEDFPSTRFRLLAFLFCFWQRVAAHKLPQKSSPPKSKILKNTLPTDRRGKTEESQVEKWKRK